MKIGSEDRKDENQQKASNKLTQEGPPKFTNSKKPSGSSKEKFEKMTKTETEKGSIKQTNKISEMQKSKPNSPALSQSDSKQSPRPSVADVSKKSKIQEEAKISPQAEKHAISMASENIEEEKEDRLAEFRNKSMLASKSQSSHSLSSSANPQCGYNPSTYEKIDLDMVHSVTTPEARQILYEKYLYQILSAEIDEETSQITILANMVQKYRQSIKSEIQNVAVQTFSNSHSSIEAHIYGSVATQLALPESDMDVVVIGVNSLGSKEKLRDNISTLFDSILENFSNKVMVK